MIQLIAGCMVFIPSFRRQILKFKMWFLPSLSIKLWFQAVFECGNAFRTQGIKRHMKWVSRQFEFLEIPRAVLSVAKNINQRINFRRDRPMKRCFTIDGRDQASFGESLPSIDDRSIIGEGSRCDFIAWRRRCVASSDSSDFHPAVVIKLEIHQLWMISTVITRTIDG